MFLCFFNFPVYETERINFIPFYNVKRLVWSKRKVIWPIPVTRYISQVFRIFLLKN